MYKAVGLDLDGTVAITLPKAIGLINAWCDTPFACRRGYQGVATEQLIRCDSAELVAKRDMGIPWYVALLVIAFHVRVEMRDSPLVEGMKEVMDELRAESRHVGIITANSGRSIDYYRERDGLTLDFAYSVWMKSWNIRRAIRKCDVDPSAFLYVGDQ